MKKLADALRARAGNRPLLMTKLSDPEARIARFVLEQVADAVEEKEMPKVAVPKVTKLRHEG